MTGKAFLPLVVGVLFGASLAQGQVSIPESSVRTAAKTKARIAHTNHIQFTGRWRRPHLAASPKIDPSIDGYQPEDIRVAYNLPSTGGSGAIAIVDAYDLPTGLNDFNVFSQRFGLPQETSLDPTAATNTVLQVVYTTGTKPAAKGDWGQEIALDIEWAHAVAPNAKIYLIECASANFSGLLEGVLKAATLPDVRQVSMSYGGDETSSELSEDSNYTAPNQVYFAAAGDTANELDYPSASPNVISVGGTSLTVTSGAFVTETAWTDGGGGPSVYEPRPAYQAGLVTGAMRGTPDMAAVGDPQTGCAVYDSTAYKGDSGWLVFGGTSLATPICAAIVNLRGDFSTSSYNEHVRQYGLQGTGSFRDIVSGNAKKYSATSGYDFITGLGSLLGSESGTFTTTTLVPTSTTVVSGTRVGGIPANLLVLDGHDYILRSVATSTSQTVVLQGTFAAPLGAGASRTGATLSITGTTTASGATVSVYNFSTAAWDQASTLALGSGGTTVKVSITDLADHFDSGGTLRFRIEGTSSSVFRFGLDRVQLSVNTD